MEIKQRLIPEEYTQIRPGLPLDPEYITVHETANTAKGANAEAHARLLEKGNTRVASWHFTVDDHQIIQHIPENEVAWHAGDGRNGTGNRKSLSLEICVNADGNFEKAKANAIELIRYLMEKHNIPLERVVPHHHWTGKDCPHNILPHWDEFVAQIRKAKEQAQQAKTAAAPAYPGHPLKRGDRGEAVKVLQRRLNIPADGIFGQQTEESVKEWQRLHDEHGRTVAPGHGLQVDGIVGPKTWKALFG